MAKMLRTRTSDGKMFYIIGSTDISREHCVIVQDISARDSIAGKTDGFVLVENATGDPTVHRGWAMYIYATNLSGKNKWIKVAEQESVDGIWGINEELLRQFVTWNNFTAALNKQNKKNEEYDKLVSQIKEIYDKAHNHSNYPTLDKFDIVGNFTVDPDSKKKIPGASKCFLMWNNKLACTTFTYEEFNKAGTSLVWRNPLNLELEPIEVENSFAIANYLIATSLIQPGTILQVKELNGSYSRYIYYKDDSGLNFEFIGMIGDSQLRHKAVTFVTELPEASATYAEKGSFYLLPPGGCGNVVGHFYRCTFDGTNFVWHDESLSETVVPADGAYFTTCHRVQWNRISMTWEDPEDADTLTGKVSFKRTYVVRKFGSAPTSKDDGVLVYVGTERNAHKLDPFLDICPITHIPVYYGLFSEGSNGGIFQINADPEKKWTVDKPTVISPEFVDWEYINAMLVNKRIRQIFSVGDILVSPYNTLLKKSIDLKITKLEDDVLQMVAIDKIGDFCYDGVEWGMKPSTDTEWMADKTYYQSNASDVEGAVKYSKYTNGHAAGDTPAKLGLFESDGDTMVFNPSFEKIKEETVEGIYYVHGKEHGHNAWENSNLFKWLNFKNRDEDWFKESGFDTRGIEFNRGFLDGFEDATTFFMMVDGVTLPSSTNNVLDALEEIPSKLWVDGSTNSKDTRYIAKIATDGVFVGTANPEAKLPVFPIITLVGIPENS